MIDLKQSLAVLAVVLATTAFASPSYAQQNPPMDATRENAIHECNVRAGSYKQYTWGDMEIVGAVCPNWARTVLVQRG